MILTDFYSFTALEGQKSVYRRDCILSTGNYLPLEQLRNKDKKLFLYLTGLPQSFNERIKTRAGLAITKTASISSIMFPDLEQPFAFGDFNGTSDALLFIFQPDQKGFELYVARGQKYNKQPLCTILTAGDLDAEIAELKKLAAKEF